MPISSTVDEFCWQYVRLTAAKVSKSTVWELDHESLAVIGNNAVPVGGQYQQCWCNLPPFLLSFLKPYNSISISSGFGTKFRKEVGNSYFYEYQNFLIGLTLCRTGGMKLVCPKPARFVQPFRYNTDL